MKSGLNTNLIEIDRIKGAITNQTKEANLIVSQFPDLLIIAAPKNQVTIAIQNEHVIISNGITEIDDDKAIVMAAIASEINDILKESLKSYAFNYVCVLEFDSKIVSEKLVDKLNAQALLSAKLVHDVSKLSYASLVIGEDLDEGLHARTILSPKLDKDEKHTNQIDLQRAVRMNSDHLPKISELANDMMRYYEDCQDIWTNLKDSVKE